MLSSACNESESDKLKVVIVSPTVLPDDAVGNATALLFHDLEQRFGASVTLIATRNERSDVLSVEVSSIGEILLDKSYLRADVIIYVFAIFSDLINTIILGNGRAARVVRFHNVTPREFVDPSERKIIDQSVDQIQIFRYADEIWADSIENIDVLVNLGLDSCKIKHMPLTVNQEYRTSLSGKPVDLVRLLFVGRLVPSKGIEDVIEACAIMNVKCDVPFRLRIIGSSRHASKWYLKKLDDKIAKYHLNDVVEVSENISRDELLDAYREAHIFTTASRHEGFCVPVIEGLIAGCVPVTYANSNLKHIAGGLARLTHKDTPYALAEALMEVAGSLYRQCDRLHLGAGSMKTKDFDFATDTYIKEFSPDVCGERTKIAIQSLCSVIRR